MYGLGKHANAWVIWEPVMANAQTNKCIRGRHETGELPWFQAKRKRTRRLNVLQRASRKVNR